MFKKQAVPVNPLKEKIPAPAHHTKRVFISPQQDIPHNCFVDPAFRDDGGKVNPDAVIAYNSLAMRVVDAPWKLVPETEVPQVNEMVRADYDSLAFECRLSVEDLQDALEFLERSQLISLESQDRGFEAQVYYEKLRDIFDCSVRLVRAPSSDFDRFADEPDFDPFADQ